jgi:NAD+ synthase (glutamine-hydrolysing)
MSSNLRIAIAQINVTLGDFSSNRKKILEQIQKASEQKCDLILFPEATLFGYHPFDLLERQQLVEMQLKEFREIEKKIPSGIAAMVGLITKNPSSRGRPYFNSAALIQKGKKSHIFHKQLLPTGDVFDEARFIEAGKTAQNIFSFKGKKILMTICEDIWAWPMKDGSSQYSENPLLSLKGKKLDLVLNMSASPFYFGKERLRQYLVEKTAKHFKAPVIYVNLVGAQDEIIFDGASFAVSKTGAEVLSCADFTEDFQVFDLDEKTKKRSTLKRLEARTLRKALVLGLKDFCEKTGLKKVHLGLSGGVDSALVACLAVEALGTQNVVGIAMPGEFNSPKSLSLARELATNLGIELVEAPIGQIYESARESIDAIFDVHEFGLVHENLQARIRGLILMAYSNKENSLLLSTSNKSEYAAGYSTLYGDMCGGLAPLGDLTKGQVYAICADYNLDEEVIPKEILTRAPSAELRPNQKDQDTLPPYDQLDQSVQKLIQNCGPVKTETDRWLLPVLMRTEFKRWQAPPILKVSAHSFGRGRRYPIAHRAKEIT